MAAQLWAVRLAEHGIPVYEVRPGIVMTDMTAAVRANYEGMMRNGLLLQARWGMPLDVGKAVVMLARGDLGYSTGQVIMVDGGMSVARL
jgi:NAD(P)-dependent dehydrogenase (short-subunit alcohol dehydrogenase family)